MTLSIIILFSLFMCLFWFIIKMLEDCSTHDTSEKRVCRKSYLLTEEGLKQFKNQQLKIEELSKELEILKNKENIQNLIKN